MRRTLVRMAAGLAAGLAAGALAVAAGGGAARAADGWTACRIQHGVLLVTVRAAGLTGPFILDTGTAHSVLDATQASLAGLETGPAVIPVTLAGRRIPAASLAVAPLDARTRTQPTPITGVIGADLLQGRVLEVRPDPCRLRLTGRPGRGGRALAELPVTMSDGVPTVEAAVSDGAAAMRGRFRVSTGLAVAVRLSPALARLEGRGGPAPAPPPPSLRALSLGGLLVEDPGADLAPAAEPGLAGDIGEPVWALHGFSLDLARGRLTLFDTAKQPPPRQGEGP